MGLLKLAHKYAVKARKLATLPLTCFYLHTCFLLSRACQELTHVVTNIVDASEESWKHEPGSWGLILHTADKIECDHLRKIVAVETVTVSQLLLRKPSLGSLLLESETQGSDNNKKRKS
eukprot:GHVQ01014745.1.p1 GENE.GHVQ01014745.1~~GHVQ01014745.1.p1  ORF type:complete len:119 (+),score=12.93 GHVQ01014745.1:779-1135(+)